MALVNSLCTMLVTSPFHRDNYARLILTVIIQFYQRCSDRFQSLVATEESQELLGGDARIALAAQWAQNPDLTLCLSQLLDTPVRNTSHVMAKTYTYCTGGCKSQAS
jgi:exocyst complex component 4